MTTHYYDLPDLASVYLEDSFVLDIIEEPGELKFRLEAVLTEHHPNYTHPKPGEQYCYADAWLTFPDVTRTDWEHRTTQRFTDASGEEDLGNIDFLERPDDHWHIGGDWGEARVHTPANPQLTFTDPTAT